MFMVTAIWLWPRMSMTTRADTPAVSRRAAQVCRKSWDRICRTPARAINRANAVFRLRGSTWRTGGSREDKPRLLPLTVGKLALLLLSAVPIQRLDHDGRHRQDATRTARLGRAEHHTVAANALQCLPHPQLSRVQIDIRPPQAEELPASQTKGQRYDEQGVQPVFLCRRQEQAGLGLGPGVNLLPVRGGCLHNRATLRASSSSRTAWPSIARSTARTC
ncbi:MAG: hypothetical protein WA890_27885 [Micromonospora sp.]